MPGTCTPCAPQPDVDLAGAASRAAVEFPIILNGRWRVVDDPLQWILQYRESDPSERSTGIRPDRFAARGAAPARSTSGCGALVSALHGIVLE